MQESRKHQKKLLHTVTLMKESCFRPITSSKRLRQGNFSRKAFQEYIQSCTSFTLLRLMLQTPLSCIVEQIHTGAFYVDCNTGKETCSQLPRKTPSQNYNTTFCLIVATFIDLDQNSNFTKPSQHRYHTELINTAN